LKGKKLNVTWYIFDSISFEIMTTVFLFLIKFLLIDNLYFDFIIVTILAGIFGFKINQIYRDLRYIARISGDEVEHWVNNDVHEGAGRKTRIKLTYLIQFLDFILLIYLFYKGFA
jgi:hypothetical protein